MRIVIFRYKALFPFQMIPNKPLMLYAIFCDGNNNYSSNEIMEITHALTAVGDSRHKFKRLVYELFA